MRTIVAVAMLAIALTFLVASADGRPLMRHSPSQFAGQVTTVPGTFTNATAAAYDPDHQVFYVFSSGTIYAVTLGGVANQLCAFASQGVGGLAYDSSNQLIYATDTQGFAIYSISRTCTTMLVAGGTRGTNDGQGAAAQFQDPTGVAFDPAHQVLYVADVDRVRAVTVGGAVTTFTPPGTIGQYGYIYQNPVVVGLSFDAVGGTLYVADTTRNMVESINGRGRLHLIAGHCVTFRNQTCDPLQIDGSLARAGFAAPDGIAFNASDHSLLVVDSRNNEVRHIALRAVSSLAGSGIVGKADGTGILASFFSPQAMALDQVSGTMLVADAGNNLLRLVTTQGSPPPPPPHGTITYDPPTYLSYPNSIAVTPDGNVWFAEADAGRIGRLTPSSGQIREFALPRYRGYPRNMILGPDGAAWFSDAALVSGAKAAVDRISSSGVITEYPVGTQSSEVDSLASGPDGNVWFTDFYEGLFGYVTPSGQVTQFQPGYQAIVSGFDGNLWTLLQNGQQSATFYRYSPAGVLLNTYPLPQGYVSSPASGPNQAIWYMVGSNVYRIGELAIDGTQTYINIPGDFGCASFGGSLAPGPNGREWYVWDEYCNGGLQPVRLASVAPGGNTRLFPIYAARSAPVSLAFGPDGTLWFADPGSNKIGKLY